MPCKLDSLSLESNGKTVTFPSRRMSVLCTVCPYALCFYDFLFFLRLVSKIPPSRYERRGDLSIKDGSDWNAQTRCVNCCTRTGAHIGISICANKGYTLYHEHFFQMIGSLRTNRCRLVLNFIRLTYGLRTRNSFEILSTLGGQAAKKPKLSS